MALGFALCATMVFAQIPAKKETRASLSGKSFEAVAMPTEDVQEQATFKGSIFSKNVVVKEVETFGAPATESTYTTGTATIPYTHTQAAGHSRWFRVADTTTGAITAAGDIAPVLFGEEGWYSSMYGFNSGSPMDGFMACSMLDQVGGDWGGTGLPGNFNTYIEFPAFTTIPAEGETIAILDAKLYQYYRCFNNDKCNIDYSTDGGVTWDSVEFNIARIDVAVNSAALGWKSVTLPQSLLNQESVKIRVRYSSNNAGGGAYGYFWMIDDFSVEGAPEANRMNVQTVSYYHGAYHMVPQDMDLAPVVWYSMFNNNGDRVQNNVGGYIKTIDGTQIAASNPDSNIAVVQGVTAYSFIDNMVDANAYEGAAESCLGEGWQGTSQSLPHATAGLNKIYSGLKSDELDYQFDTISYNVMAAEADSTYVWGRDNGILTQYSTWTYGATAEGYITEDARYAEPGYFFGMSYATGPQIPEGWVIRGIELVAHTNPQYYADVQAGMVKINPFIRWDSTYGDRISFKPIETGAGTRTVTMGDLNLDTNANVMEYGSYNTIRIMFPEQPELKPNTSYRVGYELVEQAYFCLATDRNFYYDVAEGADTAVYYKDKPELKDYANRFGLGSNGNIMVYTPEYGNISWLGSSAGKNTPMARMLVGPKRDIPTHEIAVSWNEIDSINEGIFNGSTYEIIENGTSEVVAEGSTRSYVVSPESEAYYVSSIMVDGTEVIDQCEIDPAGGFYTYTFENITARHSIAAVFTSNNGIDAIENNVKVSLQPNPATAQSQLTIEGVNGEINFSLIDMSGRVIAEEVINANEVKTINVSSLVKGTYFVRLTNSNFSKVEKLIVR